MTVFRSWGKLWDPMMQHAVDYDCECGWKMFGVYYEHIVGFEQAVHGYTEKTNALGTMVVECPRCFSFLYFHPVREQLENLQKLCPNWPKD